MDGKNDLPRDLFIESKNGWLKEVITAWWLGEVTTANGTESYNRLWLLNLNSIFYGFKQINIARRTTRSRINYVLHFLLFVGTSVSLLGKTAMQTLNLV